jgi:prevent-host-death family protein
MTPRTPRPTVVREPVALYEAKTHLSSLVDRVAAGEEFVITKSGQPMARLVPLETAPAQRVPGHGKGRWVVADDFDAPLPDALLDAFEGR